VIHNPGTVPDPGLADANTDITVVFEQSFDLYRQQAAELTTLKVDRSTQAYIIHSVPASQNLRKFVNKLAPHAQNLFLTDLSSDYYQSFGNKWSDFVRSMT
jgi:Spherulation-specific family 4